MAGPVAFPQLAGDRQPVDLSLAASEPDHATLGRLPVLDEEEQRAMSDLLSAYRRILGWGLKGNHAELLGAVHVMQNFIVQRMLHRVAPEHWGAWYQEDGPWSSLLEEE